MNIRFQTVVNLVIVVILGILIPLMVYLVVNDSRVIKGFWLFTGKLTETPTYMVYLPGGLDDTKTYPLVFALSPSANAFEMISTWSAVAEKHHWILAASKEFKNGLDFSSSLRQVMAELNSVETQWSIDRNRVIFTGISGGGMGSHAVSKFYPDRLRAIVVNTGMMAEFSSTADYPRGKFAVFLASPTDFRFNEMKRDRAFLESIQWKTKWIEFTGGHTLAPAGAYEQAAEWLEETVLK